MSGRKRKHLYGLALAIPSALLLVRRQLGRSRRWRDRLGRPGLHQQPGWRAQFERHHCHRLHRVDPVLDVQLLGVGVGCPGLRRRGERRWRHPRQDGEARGLQRPDGCQPGGRLRAADDDGRRGGRDRRRLLGGGQHHCRVAVRRPGLHRRAPAQPGREQQPDLVSHGGRGRRRRRRPRLLCRHEPWLQGAVLDRRRHLAGRAERAGIRLRLQGGFPRGQRRADVDPGHQR